MALHNSLALRCQTFKIWKDNNKLIEAQKEARKIHENNIAHITTRMKNTEIEETRPPPNDIRDIDIYPNYAELMAKDQDVYLRKNMVEGAYDSFNHYRDVIFRLTREDFMRPLREGFQNFITEKPGRPVFTDFLEYRWG